MHYRLDDNIALRGWKDVPFAYYVKGQPYARELTSREFFCMLLCDGATELEPSNTLTSLERRGLVHACEPGNAPSPWSAYRRYDNILMPKMNLMLTGRCNYNCPHCFNAADNARLMSEWGFDELCILLDQARDCGIHSVMLTGGEPLLHPRFMDVVGEIYARGMYVDKLNTNGALIDQGLLDDLRSLGCIPQMKISFDGLGCHDFMRGTAGTEERTLRAIELCLQNGFEVMTQIQVNRVTMGSLYDTLCLLDDMGVESARLIRTSESDRWLKNAADATLSVEDYYSCVLDVCRRYTEQDRAMEVFAWQLLALDPKSKRCHPIPMRFEEGGYRASCTRCPGNRQMISVTSSGEIVPCMQMSGYFAKRGISLANVRERPLADVLADDSYLAVIRDTVGDLRGRGGKCASCRHFERCGGGCPALALVLPGSEGQGIRAIGADPSKCLYFENGWQQRTEEALAGYKM